MRSLTACLILAALGTVARADDSPPIEAGVFTGGFISSSDHQLYDYSLFPGGPDSPSLPTREDLKRVSPMLGLRFAYFIRPWLGAEGELALIMTATKDTDKSANVYGGRLQLIFQYPDLTKYVVPYIALGDGFDHISSPATTLGSDTDWEPHVGAGFRILVHRRVDIRVEGRYLRAPSQQAPYTLNTGLGEIMVGVSWRAGGTTTEVAPPPPPPAVDTDRDGVLDDADRCPSEPEDKDNFDDTDGCPDPDNDADGVPDASDTCPTDAEDKDNFEDTDGCPDRDNDADGIPDAGDKCPNEPEDRDSFQDDDGCPERDNDRDGLLDAQDRCPQEPETINGIDDDDGCPDKGNSLVVVSPDRLELFESIPFKKGALGKDTLNLLPQIAATLRAHPEILRLRITVYVNPSKKPDADKALSEQRAAAIEDALVKLGIDEKRLEPRGFGGQNPLVDPKSKNAAGINNRVDLVILEKQ